jgi:hypothetical protein
MPRRINGIFICGAGFSPTMGAESAASAGHNRPAPWNWSMHRQDKFSLQKNPQEKLPMASVTKLMTLYLAVRAI